MKALLRILGLWRGRWLALGCGLAVSLAGLAMAIGMSFFAVTVVFGITGFAGTLRLLGLMRVLLRYGERLATHDAMFRALADLRVWFFRGLAARAAGGLGFRRSGDVLARLVNDVEALDGVYLRILVPLAGAVLLLAVVLVPPVMFGLPGGADIALMLAGVAMLFVLAAFVLPWRAAVAARAAGGRLAAANAALRIAALDTLGGLREVRAFGAEGRMLALVQAREAALLAAQHDLATRTAWANAAAFLCAQAAILLILVATFEMSHAVVFLLIAVTAFEAVGGLPRAGVLAGHAAAAAARVLDAAEGDTPVPDPAAPAALPPGTALRFEAVSFRWQPDRRAVFDGLTLDIPAGQRVALIGPSGIGKSTLAALALKVVGPQSGRVLLGGTDIATLAATDVRSRIAWLAQATHLFDDTIRANLLLTRPDADEPALWAALDAARIGDVVRALPEGLDTWVGESGARFSGGQGRRLALARTLLSAAPVIILDEPCAGLDAETEREFFAALNEGAAGRTVVLIAHRLTGAERLDRIWRLSGGRAVAAAG